MLTAQCSHLSSDGVCPDDSLGFYREHATTRETSQPSKQAHHMCPRTPPVCRYEESSDMLENRSELLWSGE
jgi:hypothetical protein